MASVRTNAPFREYGPAMLGSMSARLLTVWASVKASRSARGGAAGALLSPPPAARPGPPSTLVPRPPPRPPVALLPETVLWLTWSTPPRPPQTRIPPPAARPPQPLGVVDPQIISSEPSPPLPP